MSTIQDNAILVPLGGVDGKEPLDTGWTKPEYKGRVQAGKNLGARLDNLIDLDLDCDASRWLFPQLPLFKKDVMFGPKDHGPTHIVFKAPEGAKLGLMKFKVGGTTILEWRAGNKCQTMIPPSKHYEKGPLVYTSESDQLQEIENGSIESVKRIVAAYAIIAAFLEFWPEDGRHEALLAMTGYFCNTFTQQLPEKMLNSLFDKVQSWDKRGFDRSELKDRERIIRDTISRVENGQPVAGWAKVAENFGFNNSDKAQFDKLLKWAGLKKAPKAELPEDGRKTVIYTPGLEQDCAAEIVAHLQTLKNDNDDPLIVRHKSMLKFTFKDRLETFETRRSSKVALRTLVARHVIIGVHKKDGFTPIPPTVPLLEVITGHIQAAPWPEIDQIMHWPYIAAGGTLVTRQGVNDRTFLMWEHEPVAINAEATIDDAKKSWAYIYDFFDEFAYETDSDIAGFAAMLLDPMVRPLYEGVTPNFLVDKPRSESGASLLTQSAMTIYLGKQPAAMPLPKASELQKEFARQLYSGDTVALYDDVRFLTSPEYNALATSHEVTLRPLYTDKVIHFPNTITRIFTGNVPEMTAETYRRLIHVALDGEQHEGEFKHPQLVNAILENRMELLTHLLTIVSAFERNKELSTTVNKPSFEAWSEYVGGLVEMIGLKDLDNPPEERWERTREQDDKQTFYDNFYAQLEVDVKNCVRDGGRFKHDLLGKFNASTLLGAIQDTPDYDLTPPIEGWEGMSYTGHVSNEMLKAFGLFVSKEMSRQPAYKVNGVKVRLVRLGRKPGYGVEYKLQGIHDALRMKDPGNVTTPDFYKRYAEERRKPVERQDHDTDIM